ncbi:MAG: V-type ATP synthase subunit I, partial [Clostridiales bacterium]|nr:V-type ATP synthase subunit I [Clostridiales bacterium]
LGDILSYSRLLALNLAAAVICQVVNLMGALPQNMVFKTILFIVVFLIGHSINAAISLIGAYVHTCRLQYVEFFSRFYEGGGTAFAPLKANTKTFRFKEEIKHG